jgi:hypothetical protein
MLQLQLISFRRLAETSFDEKVNLIDLPWVSVENS